MSQSIVPALIRLTKYFLKCADRFQPLVTYEYVSQNRAPKQPQFYVLMFRDQLPNHDNTSTARTVTLRRLRKTTVVVEKKQLSLILGLCL
jgi:hypothetical protein